MDQHEGMVREHVRRFGKIDERLSELERAMAEITHRMRTLEIGYDKLNRVVLEGDGPENPSLVTALLIIGREFKSLKDAIDDFPKKIAMWLAIFGGAITLLIFLGPSLRKTLGLPVTDNTPHISSPVGRLEAPENATSNPHY